jgi:predicted RNase H-like HicB family nuclease
MRIEVVYHCEESAWWANSAEVLGSHVGAVTLSETLRSVKEGLPFSWPSLS